MAIALALLLLPPPLVTSLSALKHGIKTVDCTCKEDQFYGSSFCSADWIMRVCCSDFPSFEDRFFFPVVSHLTCAPACWWHNLTVIGVCLQSPKTDWRAQTCFSDGMQVLDASFLPNRLLVFKNVCWQCRMTMFVCFVWPGSLAISLQTQAQSCSCGAQLEKLTSYTRESTPKAKKNMTVVIPLTLDHSSCLLPRQAWKQHSVDLSKAPMAVVPHFLVSHGR